MIQEKKWKIIMQQIVDFIQKTYNTKEFLPLHEPKFIGNEKKYLSDCVDSTFVSSVGKYVDKFEEKLASYVGSKYAIATVNGTSALHVALLSIGVKKEDEVITQPLTFVATCNAIAYLGAKPIFVDVDLDTMGLSPSALEDFLNRNCKIENNCCINKTTNKIVRACIVMHTFGHPCRIDKIKQVCQRWHIEIVEDAAESLGSVYQGKHTGTFGKVGVFSFNGNKIITSGGGGVVVTNDEKLAKKIKHLTTTAKIAHSYEYIHDEIGYNYRMPNLNAALLVAQMEQLDFFIKSKRNLAQKYKEFFSQYKTIKFLEELQESNANYWLQVIILENKQERDMFLEFTNKQGIMTRPIWKLMNELEMFKESQCGKLVNAKYLEERVVNITSSVVL